MKPENVKCENCVFWEGEREEEGKGSLLGQCHAHPPKQAENEQGERWWPSTFDLDWCGQFRETWPVEEPPAEWHCVEHGRVGAGHVCVGAVGIDGGVI